MSGFAIRSERQGTIGGLDGAVDGLGSWTLSAHHTYEANARSGITHTDGNQVGNVPPNTSPIDPQLAPLANYGGPTATHRLLPGSPAIDAASTPDCPLTDQRGVLRPQGPACDIGSFERVVPQGRLTPA